MTPKSWTEYAAAALARERGPRCHEPRQIQGISYPVAPGDIFRVMEFDSLLTRCTLRAGHEGAHR